MKPRVVKAHPGAKTRRLNLELEAQAGVMETHPGVMKAHPDVSDTRLDLNLANGQFYHIRLTQVNFKEA